MRKLFAAIGDMMKPISRHRLRAYALLTIILAALPASAEQVPFRRAIELALKRSGTVAIGFADQSRSYQAYREQRGAFVPNVSLGSDLGYSFGAPQQLLVGTAPSLFNITTQSMVLNFAQHDVIRAARVEWNSTNLALEDKRNAVILDAAIAYTELDNLISKLKVLREIETAAQKAQFITQERVREGVDSQLDLSRGKLVVARAQMRIAEAEGNVDVLRDRLSKLTGIAAAQFETMTETVPQVPEVPHDSDAVEKALANNPAVKVAEQRVHSAELRARAEHRRLLPSIDLATQYSVLARFENYDEFYTTFKRNNYLFGATMRFPIFNLAQRARAQQADADTLRVSKETENVKDQISADTLRLQRSLRQLAAAREVARLEYEISQAGIDEVQAKIESGQANSRDQQQARIDVNDRYAAYLDRSLELYKAQLQLMRSTGDIQQWALEQN